MRMIFNGLLRLVLLTAGLLFAASLLLVAALFMLLWGLRAAWGRLTGQPVAPFVMRVDPRSGLWQVLRRRPRAPASAERADVAPGRLDRLPDIEDVEIKPPRS